MTTWDKIFVVSLIISGGLLLVMSNDIRDKRDVITVLRAENDSLRAAADTTKAYERGYNAGYESGLTVAVWYAKKAPRTAYIDTLYVNRTWGQYAITPADSAGVRTINDLFLRVRELERKHK